MSFYDAVTGVETRVVVESLPGTDACVSDTPLSSHSPQA